MLISVFFICDKKILYIKFNTNVCAVRVFTYELSCYTYAAHGIIKLGD